MEILQYLNHVLQFVKIIIF